MSTIILRTATRLLVPLGLVFAMFVYFKGHQTPGGGFVGGLVAAVAIVIERMTRGPLSIRRILPVAPSTIIGIGLALALGTGVAPVFIASADGSVLPFFTSNHGYFELPSATPYYVEWATVMTFDLGVMLTVSGVVVGMIDALSREIDDLPGEQESRR